MPTEPSAASPLPDSPLRGSPLPASPLLGFLHATIRLVPGGESTVGFLLIAAVVSAFAGLATMVLQRFQGKQQDLAHQELARQEIAVEGQPPAAAARLTATDACRWQADAPPVGSSVEGRLLEIREGTAEFTFIKGVRVVVEGPATFEILSADRFRLDQGTLAAAVPPAGIGFTVVTPTAEVIDLGTEFGVQVDGVDHTDVHVLRGEVQVRHVTKSVTEPDGDIRLLAGQAIRLVKGAGATRIAADTARFSHVLQTIVPPGTAKTQHSSNNRVEQFGQPPISFVENFSARDPGLNLTLGTPGGAAVADFSQQTFAITSGSGSRIYLGTRSTNYASVNFIFEATAIVPEGSNPWSDAFFGMGTSQPVDPVKEPAAPSALAVIRIDDATPNGFETRNSKLVHVTTADSGVVFSPKLSGKTVRLRMSWNALSRVALFELDANAANGPFQPTYALTVDGSDNNFDSRNSQLICGGGNGLQFDDIRVTVVDEPPPAAKSAPAQ